MNDRLFCQIPRTKIGIRVVVDGRCNGVREKIEAPTFALAQKAKELLESHVFHADGQPLECVIGSVGVGGVREAALVAQEFSQENVGAVISISRAFAYAAEVMVYDDQIPQAIWGFSGSERPGSVYLAAAVAVAEQKGVPIFKIYGQDVQDADDISVPQDVAKKLVLFAQCALAVSTMRNKAYLSVGNVCMGIGASIVDQEFFRCYLGMRTETVDMSEVQRRLQLNLFDPNEYQRAMAWTKANCTEMEDPNPPEIQQSRQQKDEVWSTIVKMTLILRDLMVGNPELEKLGWKEEAHGHYALMAGFQGQRQWTDFMPNGDFSEAILNSSFDWDGPRRPYTLATENDSLNAVTMLWGTLLTGTAQMFCDVRAYWSPEALAKTAGQVPEGAAANGFIYLTNSGAAALDGSMASDVDGHPGIKPAWEMTETDISRCLDATRWGAGKLATFRGGGFSSSFLSKGGVPLTMIRLNLLKGLGPVLQFAEGESVELPDNVEQAVIRRTDPTWPKTFFVPRLTGQDAFSNVYSVMENWGSNHCTLCYGHIGAQLMTLASMLRIPVCMHNLPDESIFRPAAWRMYGTHEAMSADFRACATYGPLYGPYPVRR